MGRSFGAQLYEWKAPFGTIVGGSSAGEASQNENGGSKIGLS